MYKPKHLLILILITAPAHIMKVNVKCQNNTFFGVWASCESSFEIVKKINKSAAFAYTSIFTVHWPFEYSQTLCLYICSGMQCGCGSRSLKREWKQDITTSKYFWYVRQMDKLPSVDMSACTSLSSFSLLSFFHSCPLKPPPFRDWWIIDSV